MAVCGGVCVRAAARMFTLLCAQVTEWVRHDGSAGVSSALSSAGEVTGQVSAATRHRQAPTRSWFCLL